MTVLMLNESILLMFVRITKSTSNATRLKYRMKLMKFTTPICLDGFNKAIKKNTWFLNCRNIEVTNNLEDIE